MGKLDETQMEIISGDFLGEFCNISSHIITKVADLLVGLNHGYVGFFFNLKASTTC